MQVLAQGKTVCRKKLIFYGVRRKGLFNRLDVRFAFQFQENKANIIFRKHWKARKHIRRKSNFYAKHCIVFLTGKQPMYSNIYFVYARTRQWIMLFDKFQCVKIKTASDERNYRQWEIREWYGHEYSEGRISLHVDY